MKTFLKVVVLGLVSSYGTTLISDDFDDITNSIVYNE